MSGTPPELSIMARKYRRSSEPIRATSMWRVDQVFLSRHGQRLQVVCSLVNDREGLRNLSIVAPTSDPITAIRHAARFVADKGNVARPNWVRVRWAQDQLTTEQQELIRDTELEEEFFDAFEETLQEVHDRLR